MQNAFGLIEKLVQALVTPITEEQAATVDASKYHPHIGSPTHADTNSFTIA